MEATLELLHTADELLELDASVIQKEIEEKLHKPTDITYDALGKLVGDSIDSSMNQLGVIIAVLSAKDLYTRSQHPPCFRVLPRIPHCGPVGLLGRQEVKA